MWGQSSFSRFLFLTFQIIFIVLLGFPPLISAAKQNVEVVNKYLGWLKLNKEPFGVLDSIFMEHRNNQKQFLYFDKKVWLLEHVLYMWSSGWRGLEDRKENPVKEGAKRRKKMLSFPSLPCARFVHESKIRKSKTPVCFLWTRCSSDQCPFQKQISVVFCGPGCCSAFDYACLRADIQDKIATFPKSTRQVIEIV